MIEIYCLKLVFSQLHSLLSGVQLCFILVRARKLIKYIYTHIQLQTSRTQILSGLITLLTPFLCTYQLRLQRLKERLATKTSQTYGTCIFDNPRLGSVHILSAKHISKRIFNSRSCVYKYENCFPIHPKIPNPSSTGFQKQQELKTPILNHVNTSTSGSHWNALIEALLPTIITAILPYLNTL